MYSTASETIRSEAAKTRLEHRFNIGESRQRELLELVAQTVVRDRLVPPSKMQFGFIGSELKLTYGQEDQVFDIHPHALGQICGVLGIPKTYVNRLTKGLGWEHDLLEHNLNTLAREGAYLDRSRNQAKYLNRLVGGELRGYLSRSFNRHLASLPLLRGFVHACFQVGARPVDASASAVRFSLKCFLPYVFEPVDGEFVAFGMTWSNSDFGAGRMKVALSAMRISSGTTSVLEDSISRVHIGSVIQESDLELSDDTMAKEVETQVSAIQDAVKSQLGYEPVNRLCAIIKAAHEEEVPWHSIKGEIGRLLQKHEVETVQKLLETGASDIMDLPPPGKRADGSPIATRWWASNVVGWLASKEQSADRKDDLQELAGSILKTKKKKKDKEQEQ